MTRSGCAMTMLAFALVCRPAAIQPSAPRISAPPEAFFSLVRGQDRDAARAFYAKHLDVVGMPVVASADVADRALERTHEIVTRMLAGRPDVVAAMVKNGMYLVIIGRDQVYTDIPEYRNHPNPAYQNERVRGTGGKPTSFGEENLLSLPIDRYDDESIAVHEFSHTIDGALRTIDPTWTDRRNAVYRRAVDKAVWKNTYAVSSAGEFWAEIVQAYFDCNRVNNWNHGPIGTRSALEASDSEAYELVRTTFNLTPDQDWRYTFLEKQPTVTAPPPRFGIDPAFTKFTWAREFTVLGRGASDAALLKANDTIRKMFAYRHDILKALIADGLMLVVRSRGERNSDRDKMLIVDETQLASLIPAFAKALHQVTATRPVDPNWNNRGRDVQQYELRVQRMDVRFDERLQAIHKGAMGGRRKGTAAAADRVEYWAAGVAAYFDAHVPPVATREALRSHDPDLYALVHETMGYEGRVDWRWRP